MADLKVVKKKKRTLRADTVIHTLIDMSGSMSGITQGTIEGYNAFIKEQLGLEGRVLVSLGLFDSDWRQNDEMRYVKPYSALEIQKVPKLTQDVYNPDGGTPLCDATAQAIQDVDTTLDSIHRKDNPDVIVVIITDGGENTSKRYKKPDIAQMVGARKEAGWNFIYMGANQDSWEETRSMGFSQGNVMNYSAANVKEDAFAKVARSTTAYRETSRDLKARGLVASAYTTDTFFADAGVTEDESVTFSSDTTEG